MIILYIHTMYTEWSI